MQSKIKEAINTLSELAANCKEGDRHVAVLDRGWIFCGNLKRTDDGINTLTNVLNIRKWAQGGFGGMVTKPKECGVVVDKCSTIQFRDDAMIFAVPVAEDWNE